MVSSLRCQYSHSKQSCQAPIANKSALGQHTVMHPYNIEQKRIAQVRYARLKKRRDAGLTLAEIGKLEGITRERVRQILDRGDRNG